MLALYFAQWAAGMCMNKDPRHRIRKSTLEFSIFLSLVECLRAFKVSLWFYFFSSSRFVSFPFSTKWSTFFHFDMKSSGQMSLLYERQLPAIVVFVVPTTATVKIQLVWCEFWNRHRRCRVLSIATVTKFIHWHCMAWYSLRFVDVRFTKYRIYPSQSFRASSCIFF